MSYRHRQASPMMLIPFALAATGMLVAAVLVPHASTAIAFSALLVGAVLAAVYLAFSSLEIRIEAARLTWRFGRFGWPQGSIGLADIAAVEVTRTRWLDGWGIHRTRRGWLYNVAGYDAVLVQRRDGSAVLLGTDEPRRLATALEQARPRPVSPP